MIPTRVVDHPVEAHDRSSALAVDALRAARAEARRRHVRVLSCSAAAVVALLALDVMLRSTVVPPALLVRILGGELVPGVSFIVMEDTLPRGLTGALVGVAFGVSGCTCQSLFRNSLASPDVIGVTSGAGAAAVLAISLGAQGRTVSLAALAGAVGVAVAMQLLARGDRASGARLILVGIGAAAALSAVTSYLLTRTDLRTASESLRWLTGSLNASTWDRLALLVVALAVLLPLAGVLSPSLRALETGDDNAAGLGVPVARARTALLLVAVALAGVATAAAGPVAYVAFLSGPTARRLLRGTVSLPAAGLVGAGIVLGADWLAAHVVPGTALPVGVVTGALGAPVLLAMLVAGRAGRKG